MSSNVKLPILYDIPQLKIISQNFANELIKAEKQQTSSLAYWEYPDFRIPIKNREFLQIVNIGGENFWSYLFQKTNQDLITLKQKHLVLPKFKNKQQFLTFCQKQLFPQTKKLILNLAYPLRPFIRKNRIDGYLWNINKERSFTDFLNAAVGKELENFIQAKAKRKIEVNCLNDTIYLLLTHSPPYKISLVVGTGVNMAYINRHSKAVNLEVGNFNKFSPTTTGKVIDKNSLYPGRQLLEKEVAGGYLFKHFNLIAQAQNLGIKVVSTKQLSNLCLENSPVAKLAKKIVERSASLVAAILAGTAQYLNTNSLSIVVEGSVMTHVYNYQNFLIRYSQALGLQELKINLNQYSPNKGIEKLLI